MQNVLKYLKWKITERGARIIWCDEKFEGAMEIPSRLDGAAAVSYTHLTLPTSLSV